MSYPSATLSKPSAAHDPAEAQLARYSDGSIVALSLSEPGRTYRVQLEPLACECPAFRFRSACYHSAAALARYGEVEPAPARIDRCGNCGSPVDVLTGIPPYIRERGCAPFWRCLDLNSCVRSQQAQRAAYRGCR